MSPARIQNDGEERFTSEKIVFQRPFSLGGSPEIYPAGAYQVESKLQMLEAGGHIAWVRSSTVLVVPTATGSFCREVKGSDIDEAVRKDTDAGRTSSLSENPDRGNADLAGSLK